jgi:hypothetical protein
MNHSVASLLPVLVALQATKSPSLTHSSEVVTPGLRSERETDRLCVCVWRETWYSPPITHPVYFWLVASSR